MLNSPSDPDPAPRTLSRWGPLVGVMAGLAMCAQNAGFATGIGWSLIHGAGPLAVIALLPLAVGLGLLWSGYVLLQRKQIRRGLVLFVGHAALLLVLNEWLLPSTPLKAWSSERALKSAEVSNIRDEAVTTTTGDPIGLRLTFEVRFPRRVVGLVSASAFAPSETEPPWMPYPLDFAGYEQTIEPSSNSDSLGQVFEKNVVYRVAVVRMPGFRGVDSVTGRPCSPSRSDR
jgi:hypothetical protein